MAARNRDIDLDNTEEEFDQKPYAGKGTLDIPYYKKLMSSWKVYTSGRLVKAIKMEEGFKLSVDSTGLSSFGYYGPDPTSSVGNKIEVLERLGRVSIIDHTLHKLYVGKIVR